MDDVAVHLGVTCDVVHAWVVERGLPAARVGRRLVAKLSDVDAWVRAGGAADPDLASTTDPLLDAAQRAFDEDDGETALNLARRIEADTARSSDERWAARLLAFRALTKLGRYAVARRWVEESTPTTPAQAEAILAARMRVLVETADYPEATDVARSVARNADTHTESVVAQATNLLAYLGHHREARRLADRMARSPSLATRMRSYGVFVEGGDLGRAAALVSGLSDDERVDPTVASQLAELEVPRALFAGELADVERHLLSALQVGPPAAVHALVVDAVTLATARGRRAHPPDVRADVPAAIGYQADAYALEAARNAARHGEPGPPVPVVLPSGPAWLQVREALLVAERAIVGGALAEARAVAEQGVALARASDSFTLLLESLSVRAEVALIEGAEIVELAVALETIADQAPSARAKGEAEALRLFTRGTFDLSALERVAGATDVSPVAARRAQALIGGRPPLDRIDAAVIEALSRREPWRRVHATVAPEGPFAPGWALDLEAQVIRLPADRTLPLARRTVQADLLELLARQGSASKEVLLRDVFGVRDYHRLRDDKRLQVAVHALRRAIEDDPRHPRRLVTTRDGYALGVGERFLRIDANSA